MSLTVKDTSKAINFYIRAFGAIEHFRLPRPDGGIAHAEFSIGETRIYISDEAPDWHAVAMNDDETAACLFALSTDNCDLSYQQAVKIGATALLPPSDQFWGTRSAMVRDPFGYRWSFVQRIEDVPPREIARRAEEYFRNPTRTSGNI